jgi:hypothetical protein
MEGFSWEEPQKTDMKDFPCHVGLPEGFVTSNPVGMMKRMVSPINRDVSDGKGTFCCQYLEKPSPI